MTYWATRYARLLPEQSWSSWLNYIDGRHSNVMNQVLAAVPARVEFSIQTRTGQTLSGQGWIDVQTVPTPGDRYGLRRRMAELDDLANRAPGRYY